MPEAAPSCTVWAPGCPGLASIVGDFKTLKVKSMMAVCVCDPGAPRTIDALGVNWTLPLAASMTVMVKVMPAAAVPARPVAGEAYWKTPGSRKPAGQSDPDIVRTTASS